MLEVLTMASECSSPILAVILRVVKNLLALIQIIAPLLLIAGMTYNLIKMMQNPEDKKGLSKVKNSALAAAIIFFIPVLINALMNMLGENYNISLCWGNVSDYYSEASYIRTADKKNISIFQNPDEYEKGNPSSSGGSSSSGPVDLGENIDGTAKQVGDVVWDPTNLNRISNLTSSQLVAVLNSHGGKAKNFIPYASRLITTEQKYSVNVFFLIGVEALESGWITSSISKKCNNLGGVRETKSRPSNGCGSNSGGGFAYFNSVEEFIDHHGSMLHNNYLTPGGKYYEGATPQGVVVHYCPGCTHWPSTVIKIGNSLFDDVAKVL